MAGASIPNTIPAFGGLQATSFGPGDPIASAMPMHHQQQTQQQQPQSQMASSSRILSEPDCQVFCCNKDADPIEFGAQQLITIDGKVFVEHIPGHSIVFVPNKLKAAQVMANISGGGSGAGQRVKGKSRIDKPARPCNVFFKYRSHKLAELQE
ncbi:hypothetical protein EV175_007620, partial [Coemansia sp. RSA 1933]